MKIDSQNKAEQFWDRIASGYDKEVKTDVKTYLQIIERAKRYLKSSDIVFDLGCGAGLICNELCGYIKNIDGIDLSSKMIEIAKTKDEKAGYT